MKMNADKSRMNLYRSSYTYLVLVMDKHCDVGVHLISHKKVHWVLSRFLVPRELREKIIIEMRDKKLLEFIDKRRMLIKV